MHFRWYKAKLSYKQLIKWLTESDICAFCNRVRRVGWTDYRYAPTVADNEMKHCLPSRNEYPDYFKCSVGDHLPSSEPAPGLRGLSECFAVLRREAVGRGMGDGPTCCPVLRRGAVSCGLGDGPPLAPICGLFGKSAFNNGLIQIGRHSRENLNYLKPFFYFCLSILKT